MKILQGTLRKGRPMESSKGKGQMRKVYTRAAAMILAISGAAAAAHGQAVPASGFFDWDIPAEQSENYNNSPFLDNNNAAEVATWLEEAEAAGYGNHLALKIREPITSQSAKQIFNDYAIKYVFCDFEDAQKVGQTRSIGDLVLASTRSRDAFVGNFNSYPKAGSDSTRPSNTNPDGVADSFQEEPEDFHYTDQQGRRGSRGTRGKRMANPALYPGSPDFRNQLEGGGPAPNLRSAMFTNPIKRLTLAKNSLPSGDQLIPWVNRFNNWGNPNLDDDGDGSNGYRYTQDESDPSDGQLLSRGDFSALILHYRLRGANTYHLFQASEGSVEGYSYEDQRDDARQGWAESGVASGIFSRNRFAFANLTTLIGDNGGTSGDTARRDIERAGAVWSGVYDRSGSGRRLVILFSNLSASRKTIDLPNSIGGFMTARQDGIRMDDFFLDPGQHKLVTFTLRGNKWVLNNNTNVFTDDDRNGVGIPEPTGLALVGVGALGLLARRRRRVTA
jgi:hypothetical protein